MMDGKNKKQARRENAFQRLPTLVPSFLLITPHPSRFIMELRQSSLSRRRNLLIAAVIIVLLAVSAVVVWIPLALRSESKSNDNNNSALPPFSFDDIFNAQFSPNRFSCLWVEDGSCLRQNVTSDGVQLIAYTPSLAGNTPTFTSSVFLAASQYPQVCTHFVSSLYYYTHTHTHN
jgi:hypothetical protein